MNTGSFQNNQTAYLYVIDAAGNVNANGLTITLGSGADVQETVVPTPQNLRRTDVKEAD